MKSSGLLKQTVLHWTAETKMEFIKLRSHSDVLTTARSLKLSKIRYLQQLIVCFLFCCSTCKSPIELISSGLLKQTVLYWTAETKVEFIKQRSHSDVLSAARSAKLSKIGYVKKLIVFVRHTRASNWWKAVVFLSKLSSIERRKPKWNSSSSVHTVTC